MNAKTDADKCPFCNSPSVNTSDKIECSNPKCWDEVVKKVVENKKNTNDAISVGAGTKDDPISITCPHCNGPDAVPLVTRSNVCYCYYCYKTFNYKYEIYKWYLSIERSIANYVVQYCGSGQWEMEKIDN